MAFQGLFPVFVSKTKQQRDQPPDKPSADLTGSGRGVVGAILISKVSNSSMFLARAFFVRFLLRLLFELFGISRWLRFVQLYQLDYITIKN